MEYFVPEGVTSSSLPGEEIKFLGSGMIYQVGTGNKAAGNKSTQGCHWSRRIGAVAGGLPVAQDGVWSVAEQAARHTVRVTV